MTDVTSWVALPRGVNVGGVSIRNAELGALLRDEFGFDRVRTVLASGNVTFETVHAPSARQGLKTALESALRRRFGYDAWIVLVTRAEVETAVEEFPFDASMPERQPWVIFGSNAEVLDQLTAAAASFDSDADPLARGRQVLYWNPVTGTTTDTAFGRLLARRVYRSSTTNRNLRTLQKVISS